MKSSALGHEIVRQGGAPGYVSFLWRTCAVGILACGLAIDRARAGDVVEEWVSIFDGSARGHDAAADMVVDELGNVYVTGHTIERGAGGLPQCTTIRYDVHGMVTWTARYAPENGYAIPVAISLSKNHRLCVAGYSGGASTAGVRGRDIFVLVYTLKGDLLWSAEYDRSEGDPIHETVAGCVIDGSQNVYLTGYSTIGDDNDCVVLDVPGSIPSHCTFLVVKFDVDGEFLWDARLTGDVGGARGRALSLNGDRGVVATGNRMNSSGDMDYFTMSLDGDGSLLWQSVYDGPAGGDDQATAIAVDAMGHSYVTGSSTGLSTFEDYLTIKYDVKGAEVWTARYDGPGSDYDEARVLAVDQQGNIFVTGVVIQRERFITVGGTVVRRGPTDADYGTVKYDREGTQLWVSLYDGPTIQDDIVRSLAIDGDSDVYVTGDSWTMESPTTGWDYLTVKYHSEDGRELWKRAYDSSPELGVAGDSAVKVCVDGRRNVYVTGSIGAPGNFATIKYKPVGFVRGDVDGDGEVTAGVTDAVYLLQHNFAGGDEPPCLAAADVDGDGRVAGVVTDAIYLLQFLFQGGAAPPAPYPVCARSSLASDEDLGCELAPIACR